jgi:hypothetical protein
MNLKEGKLPWFLSNHLKIQQWFQLFFSRTWGNWSEMFWLKINGQCSSEGTMDDMEFDIPFLIEFYPAEYPF